jgi:hypothetical protein
VKKRTAVAYALALVFTLARLGYVVLVGPQEFWAYHPAVVAILCVVGIFGAMFVLAWINIGRPTLSIWQSINVGDTIALPIIFWGIARSLQEFDGTDGFYVQPWFTIPFITFWVLFGLAKEYPWRVFQWLINYTESYIDGDDTFVFRLPRDFYIQFAGAPNVLDHWVSSAVGFGLVAWAAPKAIAAAPVWLWLIIAPAIGLYVGSIVYDLAIAKTTPTPATRF